MIRELFAPDSLHRRVTLARFSLAQEAEVQVHLKLKSRRNEMKRSECGENN